MRGSLKSQQHRSWNLSVGRVAGIDIKIHATFLLLLAWIAISHLVAGHGLGAAAAGLGLIVCVFGIVVLHELAHALVAKHFGVATRDITLLPIGGISSLERIPDKPREELLIALAGPSVNVVLALALFGLVALFRGALVPNHVHVVGGSFLAKLAWLNVGLAVFNLLPAFPMDGGRVLRAGLALRMDYDRATAIAARLGQAVALGFGILGFFFDPILLFIALFVWIGAQQEAALVHVRSALTGVPVEHAMITRFLTLSPDEPLIEVLQRKLAGFQTEFPVVDGDRLVGILTRDDILQALRRLGANVPVGRVMRSDFDVVARGAPVETVLPKLGAPGGHAVIVTDHGSVVGMLTTESIAQAILVDRALHARPN
jgi:Zn-dependent protease/predicted transcriptional regulator